jgi:hypothetical protein
MQDTAREFTRIQDRLRQSDVSDHIYTVHDSKVPGEAVDAIEPIKRPLGKPGRPRMRPERPHAYTRPTTFLAAARP